MKILPSGLCTDAEFLRRVYLDLTGLPPTADEVREFLADTRDSRVKRDELVDRLIGSPDFVDYWTNKWADLLAGQPQVPGRRGGGGLPQLDPQPGRRQHALRPVRPHDPDGHRLEPREPGRRRTSRSSATRRRPWRTRRSCSWRVRFNCNKCHDHPFERWTQDQYYQTAALLRAGRPEAPTRPAGERR